MHRDLTLGLAVSLLVHCGMLLSDRFVRFQSQLPSVADERPSVTIFDLPQYLPDNPEPVDPIEEQTKLYFVMREIVDTPQPVIDGGFVQNVQAPRANTQHFNPNLDLPEVFDPKGTRNVEIFDPSKLDQIPSPRFRVPPRYPFEMRRDGVQGEVLVDFLVDAQGDVQNARALQSSQKAFELPALEAVSKWKFRPGRKNGQNVITHMQVPIHFSLHGP